LSLRDSSGPRAARIRKALLALLSLVAFLSAGSSVVLIGLLAGPEFTGPRGREASWLFLIALLTLTVFPPAAASLRWLRRRDGDLSAAWVWTPAAVIAWNLAWVAILCVSTDSVFSHAVRQRGGWAVRQLTGLRPPVPVPNDDGRPEAGEAGPAAAADPAAKTPVPATHAPEKPEELFQCALRARLAATTFGGFDYLDAGAECLNRETAAALGSGTAQMLGLNSAFLQAGQGLKKLLKGGVSQKDQDKTAAEGERVNREIERALEPWGVTLNDLTFGRKQERLVPRGRRFLMEMSALKRRIESETALGRKHRKENEDKGRSPGAIDPDLVAAFADVPASAAEFGPAQGGRRRILSQGKALQEDRWELVYEDGAWRAAFLVPRAVK